MEDLICEWSSLSVTMAVCILCTCPFVLKPLSITYAARMCVCVKSVRVCMCLCLCVVCVSVSLSVWLGSCLFDEVYMTMCTLVNVCSYRSGHGTL